MLESKLGDFSRNFRGIVGETVPAQDFSNENLLIQELRYNSEGNWAFCRFDDDRIYGARIGFERGSFDLSDFGGESVESYLQLHIELMTKDGAVLWLATKKYKAEQVTTDPAEMDIRLEAGGKELFTIQGWPRVTWRFQSDDGEVEVDLVLDLTCNTILPDWLLPHNVFSMWLAVGRVEGEIRYQRTTTRVAGTVFLDHPRITVEDNPVSPIDWFLYTPMRFEDGSALISYYTVDDQANRVGYFSFGLYIDAEGGSHWMPETELAQIQFDEGKLPNAWILHWPQSKPAVTANIAVKKTSVLRVWGAPASKNFVYRPLVLEGAVTHLSNGSEQTIRGVGLAEYWHR